ncbi:MAG: hypothetical protein IAE78_15725 [Myxococcus sp.]|nr:hypothetical protein [Myxococcus sp.]
MAMLSRITSFVKPFVSNVIKSVAPGAIDALKGIAGKGIDSLFQAGAKGLQGLLGNIPFLGPLASNLVGKYAPGLADVAKNFLNGNLDKLLGQIVGQPTSRPVPGAPAGTTVTPPSIATPGRTESIIANTPAPAPSFSGAASTGVGSGATPSGGFPSYPTPPKDPKDLAAQNKFQEDMFNFQQASQNLNMYWQMMQNTLKSMGDTLRNSIGALR